MYEGQEKHHVPCITYTDTPKPRHLQQAECHQREKEIHHSK